MADVKIPYTADSFGRAAFEEVDNFLQSFLLSGVEPPLVAAINRKQKNSTTLAQFSVVGYEGNVPTGDIVMATETVKAVGVLPHASAAPASGTNLVPVWYSGCFDPDSLVWDASLNTAAERELAFVGSPTPTQIVIKKRLG